MDVLDVVRGLAEVIDGHRWDELSALLTKDFSCSYVHTGERFDRSAWVRLNADYPGFQRFLLEDYVASGNRAAARAHVIGTRDGQPEHFGVALFMTVRDGLIDEMTEVWTHMSAPTPVDRRPQ